MTTFRVPVSVRVGLVLVAALILGSAGSIAPVTRADTIPTVVFDPTLEVTTVLNTGIIQPIGIVFLAGSSDYLVLEKASGQIKRVIGGVLQPTPVLDLAVNSSSERGLLSAVLHPNFPADPSVFIWWTESSTGDRFDRDERSPPARKPRRPVRVERQLPGVRESGDCPASPANR